MLKKVLFGVFAVLVFVPAFCAETQAPAAQGRWALKNSSTGVLLMDTQTGNVWGMKPSPSDAPAQILFERIPRDGEKIDQSVQQKTSQGDSQPLSVKFTHGTDPKSYDPNRPNP